MRLSDILVKVLTNFLHPQKMNTRLNGKYIQPSQKLPSVGITKKNSTIKKAEVQARTARARDRYNKNLQKKAFEALKKAAQEERLRKQEEAAKKKAEQEVDE